MGTSSSQSSVVGVGLALVLVAGGLMKPACVSAQDPAHLTASLAWERAPGAETCMEGASLSAAIEERLGRGVMVQDGADIVLAGRIAPGEMQGTWESSFRMSDAAGRLLGERRLVSDPGECRLLDDSLSLIGALMIDLPRMEARLRLAEQLDAPDDPAPLEAGWRLGVSVGAVGSYNLQPGVALGGQVGVRLGLPQLLTLVLEGSFYTSDETPGGSGGRFETWLVGLSACVAVLENGPLSMGICAGAEAGRISGDGFGFDRNQSDRALVLGGLLRVPLGLTLTDWLALRLEPGLSVQFVRDDFVGQQPGGVVESIHQPAPVVPTLGFVIDLTFL